MEILCENCQAKIQEKGFLIITPQKSYILCKFCGLSRNNLNFSAESEIFEIKEVENRGIMLG